MFLFKFVGGVVEVVLFGKNWSLGFVCFGVGRGRVVISVLLVILDKRIVILLV